MAWVLSLFILRPERLPKLYMMLVTPCRLSLEFLMLSVMLSEKPSLKGLSLYVSLKGLIVSAVLILISRISIERMNGRLAIGSHCLHPLSILIFLKMFPACTNSGGS